MQIALKINKIHQMAIFTISPIIARNIHDFMQYSIKSVIFRKANPFPKMLEFQGFIGAIAWNSTILGHNMMLMMPQIHAHLVA